MPTQDLYVGLGSLAYAVAKADGVVRVAEIQVLEKILHHDPHGDIALFTFLMKKKTNAAPEVAYQFAFRRFAANISEFSRRQRERFFYLLNQVALAYSGICKAENALLRQIRKDLGQLDLFTGKKDIAGPKLLLD